MAGHHWAKEIVDLLNEIITDPKLNKTKIQKYIIANALRFDKDIDWHYFINRLSKKDVALLKHMLKKLRKDNVLSELRWLQSRSGALRSDLEKALIPLAYKFDKDNYLESEARGYRFYGLPIEDGKERATKMVQSIETNLSKRW